MIVVGIGRIGIYVDCEYGLLIGHCGSQTVIYWYNNL